mmetsp:Transcript_12231/g.35861  ORF Transcript_12231/g.35861 Transcript_12231/m.35861 type:complete len:291 (+) Transcript_12231:53-925(+)
MIAARRGQVRLRDWPRASGARAGRTCLEGSWMCATSCPAGRRRGARPWRRARPAAAAALRCLLSRAASSLAVPTASRPGSCASPVLPMVSRPASPTASPRACRLRASLRASPPAYRKRAWPRAAVVQVSTTASRREEDSASAPRVWLPACARAAAAAKATATAAPGRTWAAARSSPASCTTAPAPGFARAARAAAAATCARRAGARRRWLPLNHHRFSVSPAAPSCTTVRRGCRAKIRAARRPRPNVYKPARVLLVLRWTQHHPLPDRGSAQWHPPLRSHGAHKTSQHQE